ncbi:hypothetical protein Neosp_007340 [[Neocosmospora] mangrovei]
MPESTNTDSLMARPVSPITDDDQDLSTTSLNGPIEEQDVENLPENPVRHAAGLQNLISDWNLELFALASSAVSLTALIILLARQNGQQLSTWTLPLSLNTVVSFLSVVIKTPLAFVVGTSLGQGKWAWFSKRQGPLSAFVAIEEAGRGPLGSLTLIWKMKFRHWGLVQYVGKMYSTAEGGASIMRSHGLDVGEWNWNTLLASFTVMHTQEEYWSNKVEWNDAKVYATECALQYCIQVYKPTMASGKIDEGLIPVHFERVSSSWQSDETDPLALEAIDRTIGTSLAGLDLNKCLVPRSDLQLRLLDQDNLLPPHVQRTFNITQRSIMTMMSSLEFEAIIFINRALSNSTNITATFNNVARVMSYQMRDINGSTVQGYTQEWVIYIRVRWSLIFGPVVVLLATVLFFVRVVMESRGIDLETFKSEPLEMLLYGFDAKSRDHLRVTRKAGQNVEGKMIQLEEAAEGPELRLKDGPE